MVLALSVHSLYTRRKLHSLKLLAVVKYVVRNCTTCATYAVKQLASKKFDKIALVEEGECALFLFCADKSGGGLPEAEAVQGRKAMNAVRPSLQGVAGPSAAAVAFLC
jgi:hypothetical protein